MIVPNLTGFRVSRCATFHIAPYCRLPGASGPTMRGNTLASSWSWKIIPRGGARRWGQRHLARNPGHMGQRITLPAPPADLFVVMGVAVGADVEPGHLLRAEMRRHRILVLLAPAGVDHRFEEAAAAEQNGVPRRPRRRADDRRRTPNRRVATFARRPAQRVAPYRTRARG